MTDVRVTRKAIEVLYEPTRPAMRTTRIAIEVLRSVGEFSGAVGRRTLMVVYS